MFLLFINWKEKSFCDSNNIQNDFRTLSFDVIMNCLIICRVQKGKAYALSPVPLTLWLRKAQFFLFFFHHYMILLKLFISFCLKVSPQASHPVLFSVCEPEVW